MAYQLLTGATGLLGNYLLRDLLRAGRQVAVAVRASRTESARQRIESILAGWESRLGRVLPRPVVLECDISLPALGLDAIGLDWVARNCEGLIHNAASLSFDANEQTGEPYRSNVEGTRNVLEVARRTGIRQFHHVSTAYVCGLRTGTVYEDELDVGQESGNAYEKSKIEAERLVRGASFLDQPTIYRPSIIIGDSVTGYTTTYHGFYTPLKIAQAIANRVNFNIVRVDGMPLVAALDLTGEDRKNFVPVDWVSSVIVNVSGRPDRYGRTYHLTATRPATVALACEVIEEAIREYVRSRPQTKSEFPEMDEVQAMFADQMGTYRAYWRDDPDFDCRHTSEAVPHLPCPIVDREMLLRMARFALEKNFGWPRPQPLQADFDVEQHLSGLMPVHLQNGHDPRHVRLIGMQVNGPGGGQWTLAVDRRGGRPVSAECGLSGDRHGLLYLNSKTYERCVRGELPVDQADRGGQLAIEGETEGEGEGDEMSRSELLGVLGNLVRDPVRQNK